MSEDFKLEIINPDKSFLNKEGIKQRTTISNDKKSIDQTRF